MAFPIATTVLAANDDEYDAKARTEYELHRQRAHKLNDAKTHKARVASKSDRAWRVAPRPSMNSRHVRRRSATFVDDEEGDFENDGYDSEHVGSDDANDMSPTRNDIGEEHIMDGSLLSDLVVRQTRQRGMFNSSQFS